MAVSWLKSWCDAVPPADDLWEKAKCEGYVYAKAAALFGTVASGTMGIVSALAEMDKRPLHAFPLKKFATNFVRSSFVGCSGAVLFGFSVSLIQETRLRKMAASSVGDETVVLFMPKYDELSSPISHHYPFIIDPRQGAYQWATLAAKGKKLVVQRVETADEIVSTLNKIEKIQTVLMVFHGDEAGRIHFTRFDPSGSDPEFFARVDRRRFAKSAQAVIHSCYLGKKPEGRSFSFAERAQSLLGPKVQVVAGDRAVHGLRITPQKDGTVEFDLLGSSGDIITVRPHYTVSLYKTALEKAKRLLIGGERA